MYVRYVLLPRTINWKWIHLSTRFHYSLVWAVRSAVNSLNWRQYTKQFQWVCGFRFRIIITRIALLIRTDCENYFIALQSVSKYPCQVNGKTSSWKILEQYAITWWTTRGQGAMNVYGIKEITYNCSKCIFMWLFAKMKGTAKSDQSLVGGHLMN